MRDLIKFTPEEQKAYNAGLLIRKYGEQTNQPIYGFADSFYTQSTMQVDGKSATLISFKAHSFKNLLQAEPPKDIISKEGDKLVIAFTIGLVGGKEHWNVPKVEITKETLEQFFMERPKVSPSYISEEAGFSAKYLRLILSGDRPLTDSAISKLKPVLELHGWGRKKMGKTGVQQPPSHGYGYSE